VKILLTGAAGFVGSFVVEQLLKLHYRVAVILRPNTDTWRIKALMNQCTVIKHSLEQIELAEEELTQFSPDVFIHLAWEGVSGDKRDAAEQITVNLALLTRLFFVVKRAGVHTIIGLGSQAEFGVLNQAADELHPTQPTTLYGVAKLGACHLLRVLCDSHHIRFVWHRLFSAYGPKDHPGSFIAFLIRTLVAGNMPQLTAGTQLWDFIFIEDAAAAIIKTMANPKASGLFNLGSGKPVTIRSVAEELGRIINPGLALTFGHIPFSANQVMHLEADISHLQKMVSWQPEVCLSEGLNRTLEWFLESNQREL
jgi:UDP-glucose 4-epimerase